MGKRRVVLAAAATLLASVGPAWATDEHLDCDASGCRGSVATADATLAVTCGLQRCAGEVGIPPGTRFWWFEVHRRPACLDGVCA